MRDRLLGMIRDNLERDQVSATASTLTTSTAEDDTDEEEDKVISDAERNRLLIEKMSQGQPERKKSYSASRNHMNCHKNSNLSGMSTLKIVSRC